MSFVPSTKTGVYVIMAFRVLCLVVVGVGVGHATNGWLGLGVAMVLSQVSLK